MIIKKNPFKSVETPCLFHFNFKLFFGFLIIFYLGNTRSFFVRTFYLFALPFRERCFSLTLMPSPVSFNPKNVSLLKTEQKIRPTITKDNDTIKTPQNSILHICFGDIKHQKCFWFKDLKSFYCKDSLCKYICVFSTTKN